VKVDSAKPQAAQLIGKSLAALGYFGKMRELK